MEDNEKIITVAIVDDCLESQNRIIQLLKKLENLEREVDFLIERFISGEAFLNSEMVFDIIILDYEMPGKTGLDVVKTLYCENSKADVIIFSGYTGQSGYITREKIMQETQGYRGVRRFLFKSDEDGSILLQMNLVVQERLNLEWIEIDYYERNKTAYGDETKLDHYSARILVQNITHILTTSNRNEIEYFLGNNETYTCRDTITNVLKKLPNFLFLKCERGAIVNLSYIKSISKNSILLTTEEEINLTKSHSSEIIRAHENYLFGGK